MSDLNNFSPRIKEIFEHRHDDYDRNELGVRDYWYSKVFSGSSAKNKAYLVAEGFEQFLAHKKILIKEIDILAREENHKFINCHDYIGDKRSNARPRKRRIRPSLSFRRQECSQARTAFSSTA